MLYDGIGRIPMSWDCCSFLVMLAGFLKRVVRVSAVPVYGAENEEPRIPGALNTTAKIIKFHHILFPSISHESMGVVLERRRACLRNLCPYLLTTSQTATMTVSPVERAIGQCSWPFDCAYPRARSSFCAK